MSHWMNSAELKIFLSSGICNLNLPHSFFSLCQIKFKSTCVGGSVSFVDVNVNLTSVAMAATKRITTKIVAG